MIERVLAGGGWVAVVAGVLCVAASGCGHVGSRQRAATRPAVAAAFNQEFQILPWELPGKKEALLGDPTHGIASLAECGFTTAAFPTPAQLPLCERAGLR